MGTACVPASVGGGLSGSPSAGGTRTGAAQGGRPRRGLPMWANRSESSPQTPSFDDDDNDDDHAAATADPSGPSLARGEAQATAGGSGGGAAHRHADSYTTPGRRPTTERALETEGRPRGDGKVRLVVHLQSRRRLDRLMRGRVPGGEDTRTNFSVGASARRVSSHGAVGRARPAAAEESPAAS